MKQKPHRLAICVPMSWHYAPREFFASFVRLIMPGAYFRFDEAGVEKYWVILDRSFPLDLSRNRLVEKAMETGATHILFLDADNVFPEDLINRLFDIDADIGAALYFKKSPPFAPVPSMMDVPEDPQLMRPINYPDQSGVVECDIVGMGATLIRREVFEKINKPWFAYEVYRKTGETSVTEDVTFCRKARAAGFKIACDTDIVCGHLRWESVGPAHWNGWKNEFGKESETRDGK